MKIQNNSLQEQPLQIGNLKKLLSKFNQTNNETSHSISANTQIDLNNITSCLEIVIVSAITAKLSALMNLEEIDFLKSQTEVKQQINTGDHQFYEEKIKDFENQLTELSSNFGESVLFSLSQDFECSQIFRNPRKFFSVVMYAYVYIDMCI